MKPFSRIVGVVALLVLVPVLVASIFKAPLDLSLKIIVVGLLILMGLIFVVLVEILDELKSISIYTRANFVANETKRLNPDNQESALNILEGDLKESADFEKFKSEIGSGLSPAKQWLIISCVWAVITVGMLYMWPKA